MIARSPARAVREEVPPRVLILTDFYLPGYRGGGPIRTISHLVEHLGDAFHFRIITSDRDLGATEPYPALLEDWQPVGAAMVLYVAPSQRTLRSLIRVLRDTAHDLLYLNGLFSRTTIRVLILRRARLIPDRPTILAPRGELSPGALGFKRIRKRVFIRLAAVLRLFDGITWQASTELEEADIVHALGTPRPAVLVGTDLPPAQRRAVSSAHRPKTRGAAKIVFLSRIVRKKNLDHALAALQGVSGTVEFDVYGPLEDRQYWSECEALVAALPRNVRVRYQGEVDPEAVVDVIFQYDLFVLPTRSENFGYVILEALMAGCPVLIADTTPWRNLQALKAGWDLPLEPRQRFTEAIQEVVNMGEEDHANWRRGARALADAAAGDDGPVAANRALLTRALTDGAVVKKSRRFSWKRT